MISPSEKTKSTPQTGSQLPQVTAGTLKGRTVENTQKSKLYYAFIPPYLVCKSFSTIGLVAKAFTFRPVAFSLGALTWSASKAFYYGCSTAAVAARFFQGRALLMTSEQVMSSYTQSIYSNAQVGRDLSGGVFSTVASYIPVVGGFLVSAEKIEGVAERMVNTAGKTATVTSITSGMSLFKAGCLFFETGCKKAASLFKKSADISYAVMNNPSYFQQMLQCFSDRCDSYAYKLIKPYAPKKHEVITYSERKKINVASDEALSDFLQLPQEEQQNRLFLVSSSPTLELTSVEIDAYEKAVEKVTTSLLSCTEEGFIHDVQLVRELIGLYDNLDQEYIEEAITPGDIDEKIVLGNPITTRIRILEILNEIASDLSSEELKLLGNFLKDKTIAHWKSLGKGEQSSLEKIACDHFNRLNTEDKQKIYDITPEQIWNLEKGLKVDFFQNIYPFLKEKNIERYKKIDPKKDVQLVMENWDEVQLLVEALNEKLSFKDKVQLQHLFLPSVQVVAFTEGEIKDKIKCVEDKIKADVFKNKEEKKNAVRYLAILQSTLFSQSPKQHVLPSNEKFDTTKIHEKVGKDVVTQGHLFTPLHVLDIAVKKSVFHTASRVGEFAAWASNPTAIQGAAVLLSMGCSFLQNQAVLVSSLKSVGLLSHAEEVERYVLSSASHLLEPLSFANKLYSSQLKLLQHWFSAVVVLGQKLHNPREYEHVQKGLIENVLQAKNAFCNSVQDPSYISSVEGATKQLLQFCRQTNDLFLKELKNNPDSLENLKKVVGSLESTSAVTKLSSSLKNAWKWGLSFISGGVSDPEVSQKVTEALEKFTTLQQTSLQVTSLEKSISFLEKIPFLSWFLSTGVGKDTSCIIENYGLNYLSLLQFISKSNQVGLDSGSAILSPHLKRGGIKDYVRSFGEGTVNGLFSITDAMTSDPWEASLVAKSVFAKTVAAGSGVLLATSLGFTTLPLTGALVAFVLPSAIIAGGESLAKNMQPMWQSFAKAARSALQEDVKGGFLTQIGEYLQKKQNDGFHIDESRVNGFLFLTENEQQHVVELILQSKKLNQEVKKNLQDEWKTFKSLSEIKKKKLIETILFAYDDLTYDELLKISPTSFCFLPEKIKNRIIRIVEKDNPPTVEEKNSNQFFPLIVDKFNQLDESVRSAIKVMTQEEYYGLEEEAQDELRFLTVSSTFYEDFYSYPRTEKRNLSFEDRFLEWQKHPTGEDLFKFLNAYGELQQSERKGITPLRLRAAGDAKILHALKILDTYHSYRMEFNDINLNDLKRLIQLEPSLTPEQREEKHVLVTALCFALRSMDESQQWLLLDMTEEEITSRAQNSIFLNSLYTFLVSKKVDGSEEAVVESRSSLNAKKITTLFNSLSCADKALFREDDVASQPDIKSILKQQITVRDPDILFIRETMGKNRINIELLIFSTEFILLEARKNVTGDPKNAIENLEEELKHLKNNKDDYKVEEFYEKRLLYEKQIESILYKNMPKQSLAKIQRCEARAEIYSRENAFFEEKLKELLYLRSQLAQLLHDAGGEEIPKLPESEEKKRDKNIRLALEGKNKRDAEADQEVLGIDPDRKNFENICDTVLSRIIVEQKKVDRDIAEMREELHFLSKKSAIALISSSTPVPLPISSGEESEISDKLDEIKPIAKKSIETSVSLSERIKNSVEMKIINDQIKYCLFDKKCLKERELKIRDKIKLLVSRKEPDQIILNKIQSKQPELHTKTEILSKIAPLSMLKNTQNWLRKMKNFFSRLIFPVDSVKQVNEEKKPNFFALFKKWLGIVE